MADRGRKAFPVASTVLEERWVAQCKAMHKQRLRDIKPRIDTAEPECTKILLDVSHNPKRAQLAMDRQYEVDLENRLLLEKLMRIKNTDTTKLFKPWLARSTFQMKGGVYFDPSSSTTFVDHINSSMASSPRSIHYVGVRPGSAPATTFRAQQIYMHTLNENSKLLEAIASSKSLYSVQALDQQHSVDRCRVRAISNFRGPESARYRPASAHPTVFASGMRSRPTSVSASALAHAAISSRAGRGSVSCGNSPRDTIHEERVLDHDSGSQVPEDDQSQGSQPEDGDDDGTEGDGEREEDDFDSHGQNARPGTAGFGNATGSAGFRFLDTEYPERSDLMTAYGGGLAAIRRVGAQRRAEVRIPSALSPYLATTNRVLSAKKKEDFQ